MNVAVVDFGKPGANFRWAMVGDTTGEGNDIDVCVKSLAQALRNGPLPLGFEAPMFVPIRTDPKRLTAARKGDSGKGLQSRPFSASAGVTVLVTGLVVVSYILNTLRPLVPEAIATLDWRSPPADPGRLMLFEVGAQSSDRILPILLTSSDWQQAFLQAQSCSFF
jgi:hypothetical protein